MSLPPIRKRILNNVMRVYRDNLNNPTLDASKIQRLERATIAIRERLERDARYELEIEQQLKEQELLKRQLSLFE